MIFRRSIFVKMFTNLAIVLVLYSLIVVFGTQIFVKLEQGNIVKNTLVDTGSRAAEVYTESQGDLQGLYQLAESTNTYIEISFTGGSIKAGYRESFEGGITRGSFLERRDDFEIYEEYSASGGHKIAEYLTAVKSYGEFVVEVRQSLQGNTFVLSRTQLVTRLLIVAAFVLSLAWAIIYSRIFTLPITEMSRATKEMSRLNFSHRIHIDNCDEVGQLAASINDISKSLSAALDELKLKNQRLTEELERARGLDEMRKRFVSDVSHELKTPLAIIQGYAEALSLTAERSADKKLADKTNKYSSSIIDETQRMTKLVYDLLNLTNYQSGNYQLNLCDVAIDELLSQLADKMRQTKAAEGIGIELDATPFTVVADPDRLEQVVSNLLFNALSHSEPQENQNQIVKVKGIVTKTGYNISVFNYGKPIGSEEIDKIWTPFFRGDNSRSREGGRYGIGLSIVKALLDLHGATYGVKNCTDGVEFFFELKNEVRRREQPNEPVI